MTAAVLDASALLALLRQEPGAEKVREVLSDAAMSAVNLAEVAGYLARNGATLAEIAEALSPLPIERIPFGEEDAYDTAMLMTATRSAGLSLGDRACLALAKRLGLPALTADRNWSSVASAVGVRVTVIRG
jgi:PIN domain nuclease of toxin-antitoxin system